ncbi:MAG TPA: hypothetical protein VF261_00915, partial [Candidatus Saccharimonadales bacterium]
GGCTIAVAVSGGTHPLSGGSYTTAPAGTVTVSINGQTAHTFTMDQGGGAYNGSFIYEPTSSGTETVTATAVDSVLYSGSNSESITFTAPSTITLGETYDPGSGIATFNWTGGTGTVTVYKVSGPGAGTLVCSSSGSSCKSDKSGSKSVNSGDQVYAQDSNGDKSSTITIT